MGMPQIINVEQTEWDEWTLGISDVARRRLANWIIHSVTQVTKTPNGLVLDRRDWNKDGVSKLISIDGTESSGHD